MRSQKQRGRRPAVSGRYQVEGERIAYDSDEGRTFEGVCANGVLRQADMLFYKVN